MLAKVPRNVAWRLPAEIDEATVTPMGPGDGVPRSLRAQQFAGTDMRRLEHSANRKSRVGSFIHPSSTNCGRPELRRSPRLGAEMIQRARVLTLATAGLLAGCMSERPARFAAETVQTVPLHVLARNIEDYRGRTVRVCGGRLRPNRDATGNIRSWHLSVSDPVSPPPSTAYVIIRPCAQERPRLTRGCAVGRIARENGSLDAPESMVIASHSIGSREWWLHPQCRADSPAGSRSQER
jgi:hypothetical protein